MQFYSEFHKVSKGYRPLHGLHKQVYKARQTARFRLLSVTGQQQLSPMHPLLPCCPSPFTTQFTPEAFIVFPWIFVLAPLQDTKSFQTI